jgi:hypothetical protein
MAATREAHARGRHGGAVQTQAGNEEVAVQRVRQPDCLMNSTINIRVEGQHRSISSDLE